MAAITVSSAPEHGHSLSAAFGITFSAVASVPFWVAALLLLRAVRRAFGRAA